MEQDGMVWTGTEGAPLRQNAWRRGRCAVLAWIGAAVVLAGCNSMTPRQTGGGDAESGGPPPEVREAPGRILLSNGLVEYQFDTTIGYDLTACRFGQGNREIAFSSAGFVYCEAGIWKQECKPQAVGPSAPDAFCDFRHEVLDEGGRKLLRVTSHNDRLRVTKTFSLGPGDPALRMTYRIEATAAHQVEWGYTSLFRLTRRPDQWIAVCLGDRHAGFRAAMGLAPHRDNLGGDRKQVAGARDISSHRPRPGSA